MAKLTGILIFLDLIFVGLVAAQPVGSNLGDQAGERLPSGALAQLGADCFRHEGNILALAFTADGKTLAGYTVSSGIIIWDAKTGHVRQSVPVNLATHSFALALSPDGALIAAVEGPPWGKQYKISLWDTSTGKLAGTLPVTADQGATAPASPLCFAPDGKSLAVSSGGSALVFDIVSGGLRCTLGRKGMQSFRCAFSPDCKILVSAVYAAQPNATEPGDARLILQLWDIATVKLIRALGDLSPVDAKGPSGPIAFAPDGKSLAYACADRILLFDTVTGKRLGELEAKLGRITDLAFTSNGSRLVSNSDTGAILVWNMNTRAIMRAIEKGEPGKRQMALASGSQTLAVSTPPSTGASTQTVRLWDIATGEEGATREQGHDLAINFLAWSADGRTLVSGADDKVLFWNKDFKRRSDVLPGHLKLLAMSRDGQLAGVERARHDTGFGATGTALHIVDTASAKVSKVLDLPSRTMLEAATFARDGRKLFTLESHLISDGNTQRDFRLELALRHWNVVSAKEERLWRMPFSPRVHAFASVDGKAVLGIQRGQVGVHDAESGRTRSFEGLANLSIHSLSPSPDARLVALALRDGPNLVTTSNVLLVDMLTGKPTVLLKGDTANVSVVAWAPDSRTVAIGDIRPTYTVADNVHIHLWDALTGRKISRIGGVNSDITALGFAPDAAALATGLRDGSIFVFGVPRANSDEVPATALSKDEAEECWKRLLSDDAGAAHRAVGALTASPTVTVPLLASRLKPARFPDKTRIRQLIADLDNPAFASRQSATKELQAFGDQALVQIRLALKENLTLEARRRLAQIFSVLVDVTSPETVRTMRGIMALERIGSKEAMVVLQALARGEPEARETKDARAALERLTLRLPKGP